MTVARVPLFPLNTVLFPGGHLSLRIFEPRYVDLVRRCLANTEPFGVVLIKHGSETGEVDMFDVGTLATIDDWQLGSDGLLEISALGGSRFVLSASFRSKDGLYIGSVRVLPDELPHPVGPEFAGLVELVPRLRADLSDTDLQLDDAVWVSYRLAERLPVDREFLQTLLECEQAQERLEKMSRLLESGLGYDRSHH